MSFDDIKTQAVAEWEALQKSDKVRILIGMATCGRAAGASDILDAIENDSTSMLLLHKLDVSVYVTRNPW
jgi:hypothetical protein